MATAFSLDKVVSLPPLALAQAVRKGLPVSAVRSLIAGSAITISDLARVIGPRRTLDRRLKDDAPLTPDESDRLVRFVSILDLATTAFGSRPDAIAWMREPKQAFDGASALDLVRSDAGARAVETLFLQARHGMLA